MHYQRWKKKGNLEPRQFVAMPVNNHFMYGAYCAMLNRCRNPNNQSYGSYGARGITVCERWNDFWTFLKDMGERPPGMTLDRIDPTKGYSPENCRWATAKQQRYNLSKEGDERQRSAVSSHMKRIWAARRSVTGTVTDPR